MQPDHRLAGRLKVRSNTAKPIAALALSDLAFNCISHAERYYGDRSRGEVIRETNQLPPNPRLTAGTTLKIPEIPGLPFARPRPAAPPPPAPGPTVVAPARPDSAREEAPPEVNPLIAEAREAVDRNDYPLALGDLDKLLAGDPANREGLTLKKLVLYRHGKNLSEQRSEERRVGKECRL